MHRNFEGYADPTAGEAVSKVMREYKKKQRAVWQRRYDLMHRKKVYVASPFAGDIKSNIAHAIGYCRYVIARNGQPIAGHLLYPQILDDSNPIEREIGLMFGLALLEICDEVWCFGVMSEGMKLEISVAKKMGKTIRYIKEVG